MVSDTVVVVTISNHCSDGDGTWGMSCTLRWTFSVSRTTLRFFPNENIIIRVLCGLRVAACDALFVTCLLSNCSCGL